MKLLVFLGPSLPLERAKKICQGHYRPPVAQGDVLRAAMADKYDAIVIIDGFFESQAAVWHKEILWALSEGIAVYGASSMGALRAAELDLFGMIGMGKIFDAYKRGRFDPFDDPFEGDDEVAVLHGPEDALHLSSLPLVDVRARLHLACEKNLLSQENAQAILSKAKTHFYKDRTRRTIESMALSLSDDCTDFVQWFRSCDLSQKQLDAEELLKHLAKEGPKQQEVSFRFEWTAQWQRFLDSLELA